MQLTNYILKKPLVANLITMLIILIGILSFFQLKQSTYPNVDFDILKITTLYPGASAEDVEINVTNVIEDELETVDNIDKVMSSSLENLSIIYVFMDTNSPNIERAKDEVARAVDRVSDLPPEVDEKPIIKELRSTNVAIIELAIVGHADEKTLRKVAKDLEEDIKEIPGTGSIEKVGYRKREVNIGLSTDSLDKNYLSFQDIIQSIKARNVRTSGGNLSSVTNEKKIVTFAEFESPAKVSDVIVRSNFSGQQVQLKDIAHIQNGYEDYDVIARTNLQNSINLLIRSQASADIIDISQKIKDLVKHYREFLPDNVDIVIVSDFSHYTDKLLSIVKNNALIGFFMVLLTLFIFLSSYTAIWTALGIPLSVLGAVILFPAFDIDINFLSLLTMVLVLGILVDDAIIIAENISRHREMGKSPLEAASMGVKEVFWPVTTTVFTTILAFIPMFFMSGITGKFVVQIPLVVILTLGLSLCESTLILPAHIAHSPKDKPRRLLWFENVKNSYERLLTFALHHRAATMGLFIAFLIGSGCLMTLGMKLELFPYDDIDIFYVIAELPEGSSQVQTTHKMMEVEEVINQISRDEMVNFTTRIGHHDTDVYGATSGLRDNWGMIAVYLKPAEERPRKSEAIMAGLEKELKKLKGFDKLYLDKFNDGPPIGKPVTITFVSDHDNEREAFAQEAYTFLKHTEGITSLDIDTKPGKQELRLKPNFELMSRLGITSQAVANTLRAAYDGIVATDMTLEGEEIDFRVQLNEEQRKNPDIISALHVPNREGRLVPLGSFIQLVPSHSFDTIKHYNGRRSMTITADVVKGKLTSIEANRLIEKQFAKRVEATPGLKLIFGGEGKATQESMESFYLAFICALVAIYCVLIVLFQSYIVKPFVIMTAIPFGLAGVIITLFLHGMPISFLAMIGSLGLVGIVVNDSLIMVDYLNKLSHEKKVLNRDIIIQGAKTRLRPVLLTTITTVAGLVPTIYGFGGYEPFLVPIVLSVAGGLIFATAITLILVPVLYSLMHDWMGVRL